MKTETSITVTEAARNFADCVNRAHYQNVTFVLLKNGVPFARLTPARGNASTGRELAKTVSKATLRPSDAKRWVAERKLARKKLEAPPDKWA